jgi:hypothetical protein
MRLGEGDSDRYQAYKYNYRLICDTLFSMGQKSTSKGCKFAAGRTPLSVTTCLSPVPPVVPACEPGYVISDSPDGINTEKVSPVDIRYKKIEMHLKNGP